VTVTTVPLGNSRALPPLNRAATAQLGRIPVRPLLSFSVWLVRKALSKSAQALPCAKTALRASFNLILGHRRV